MLVGARLPLPYVRGRAPASPSPPQAPGGRGSGGSEVERELFGDHTFFLNSDGLNVVEPNETSARAGTVVNIANWTNAHLTSLAPHEPEPTEIIVMLETEH